MTSSSFPFSSRLSHGQLAAGAALLLVSLEVGAFAVLKNPSSVAFAAGVSLYAAVGGVFGWVSRLPRRSGVNKTLVNGLWQVFNIVLVSSFGVLAFGDELTRRQTAGVALAAVSAALMLL